MLRVGVGGTLTLCPGKIIWKRSSWNWWHRSPIGWGFDIGPDLWEVNLSYATCKTGGRHPPWAGLIVEGFGALFWALLWIVQGFDALFVAVVLIVVGFGALLVALFTGGMRKTIDVAGHNFSVKNADSWLRDIDRARLSAGDVHADVRRPMTVEEAERELGAQSL